MLFFKKLNHSAAGGGLTLLLLCIFASAASAQQAILHLKSGDKISGVIISENTNLVVISNAWVKALSIPLGEISKREIQKPAKAPAPVVVKAKPKPAPTAPPKQIALAQTAKKPNAKPKGKWKGSARVGLDAIVSTTDQQDYSGHLQFVYERPYASNAKKFFRNTSDFDGEYQRTDGEESANHADATDKSDFDIGKTAYGYALFGIGYDDMQKINFKYQIGPGAGIHLIQSKNFTINAEGGMDYSKQFRQDVSDLETLSFRLGEDFTWKIMKNLKLTENLAFYPNIQNDGQFRNNFTSTLSYGFWKNLSLNLTARDDYDTQVAPDVDPNRFEIRSSLGVTF